MLSAAAASQADLAGGLEGLGLRGGSASKVATAGLWGAGFAGIVCAGARVTGVCNCVAGGLLWLSGSPSGASVS